MGKIKTFLYGVIFLIIFIIVFISSNNVIPTAVFADNDTYTVNPVITILTHGLGGAPKDWSNNGYFIINESCNQTQTQLKYKETF